MADMSTFYTRREGIREQQVGGDRMLFDDASNSVHVLNGSAAFIWDCLKAPVSEADILSALGREFDLSSAKDVDGMVSRTVVSLVGKGLLVKVEQGRAG